MEMSELNIKEKEIIANAKAYFDAITDCRILYKQKQSPIKWILAIFTNLLVTAMITVLLIYIDRIGATIIVALPLSATSFAWTIIMIKQRHKVGEFFVFTSGGIKHCFCVINKKIYYRYDEKLTFFIRGKKIEKALGLSHGAFDFEKLNPDAHSFSESIFDNKKVIQYKIIGQLIYFFDDGDSDSGGLCKVYIEDDKIVRVDAPRNIFEYYYDEVKIELPENFLKACEKFNIKAPKHPKIKYL